MQSKDVWGVLEIGVLEDPYAHGHVMFRDVYVLAMPSSQQGEARMI